jgi:FkbM family methyltransferase
MTQELIQGKWVTRHTTMVGTYWIPDEPGGDIIGSQILGNQVFDGHVLDLFKPYFTPDAVMLDLGSNLGQMAIEFSHYVAEVHAFEAHPFIYELMSRNIKENQRHNIVPHLGAVWDSPDLELFYPAPNFSHFNCWGSWGINPLAQVNKDGVVVKSLTIDSLNLPRVDLVKIDIQGADLRAMLGMVKTIQRHQPRIVFEYEPAFSESLFGETVADYLQFVDNIGYRVVTEVQNNYLIEPK